MTTYHWVTTGGSIAGGITSGQTVDATLLVPAGGQVNRVIMRNVVVQFQQSGSGLTYLQGVSIKVTCGTSDPANTGGIRSGNYDIPVSALAVTDDLTAIQSTTVSWHAGDRELGFDAKNLRYGEYNGTSAIGVGCELQVYANNAGATLLAAGEIDFELAVLYSTRP